MREFESAPANTRLLIIHADDLGLSHSVNRASFAALDEGIMTSASVMVTCPWFNEVAEFAKARPNIDLGIHVTMTSEWSPYRWRPILGRRARSLTDEQGFLHATVEGFVNSVRLGEMKQEIRAQIETALRAGVQPTHVDSHMHAHGYNSLIYEAFSEVAADFSLPHTTATYERAGRRIVARRETVLGTRPRILQAPPGTALIDWKVMYSELLRSVGPGLNQLTVHVGFDEPELCAITCERSGWNASWRQHDLQVISSAHFRDLLTSLQIKLTSWKEFFTTHPSKEKAVNAAQ